MSDADRQRWDARHGAVGAAGAAGAMPPDALRGREHLLPGGGRALDVACGRGGVAVWLAGRGFAVDAVDVSEVGLAAGAALAADAGAAGRVRWWAHDLDAGLPQGCAGPYDVVVCQRFREPALYPLLAGLLAPGGLLVVTVLSEVDEGPGPFRAAAGELLAAFGGLAVVDHRERDGEASLLARRG
ncbi:methyltransferase type 12 [Pseudonocardia sp. CNS-139]|nr:methyltransferase type 12 [Pseudonocardia sp. CNS-139]